MAGSTVGRTIPSEPATEKTFLIEVARRFMSSKLASYLLPSKDEPGGRQGDHYKSGVHDERSLPPRRGLLEGKGAGEIIHAERSEAADVGQRGDDACDDKSDYSDAGGRDCGPH